MFGRRRSSAALREMQQLTLEAKKGSDLRVKYAEQAYRNVLQRCREHAAGEKRQAECQIEFEGCVAGNDNLVKFIRDDVANRLRQEGFGVSALTQYLIRVSW